MIHTYRLKTSKSEFRPITDLARDALARSGISDGVCIVYCPHTTAGVTVNENADPDVVRDMLYALEQTYPDRPQFRHAEGNSAAHVKASVIGNSVTLLVADGRLVLGTWQGVYFCEFDGPRNRDVFIRMLAA